MNVQLLPKKVSVLSIPRDTFWLFNNGVLRFLHKASRKNYFSNKFRSSEQQDSDDDYDYVTDNSSNSSKYNTSYTNLTNSIDSLNNYSSDEKEHDSHESHEDNEAEDYLFFNLAFTPLECTIMLSTSLVSTFFEQPLLVSRTMNYDVKLIEESFLVLQVDSDGIEDTSRVLDLTEPLSKNGISLFFLSSHFGDIVLIPESAESKVISILEKKGFFFSNNSQSYIVDSLNVDNMGSEQNTLIPNSTLMDNYPRRTSIIENIEDHSFELFKQAGITPKINEKIKLLLTGSRTSDAADAILITANALASQTMDEFTDYFAITRTSINEVSLLLPKSSKARKQLGFSSTLLIGSTQDVIIPISIDLSKLPLDSAGIVAGLASRLLNGVKLLKTSNASELDQMIFEVIYFSMARSAILMIPVENCQVIGNLLDDSHYDRLKNSESIPKHIDVDINDIRVPIETFNI